MKRLDLQKHFHPRPSRARRAVFLALAAAVAVPTARELTPALVYSVVLAFFGLGSVFATLGLLAAACGFVTWRYLPKSL